MKYYLIAGEASGDLHASHLMRSLKKVDSEAEFRFFGGDLMQAEGGTCVCHYSQLAYMGFIPVLLHLRTILRWRSRCKADIARWPPDAVILVDYPGFNLDIASYVHSRLSLPVYYYISPKIWAWKEYRIKNIKRDVDELFSILPFEVDFFEHKHHYPIHYVGNPTASEVDEFRRGYSETFLQFTTRHQLADQPIVALLAGSRQQEIKDNLPAMLQVAERFPDYQFVVAGAPSIGADVYERHLAGSRVRVVHLKDGDADGHGCSLGSGTAPVAAVRRYALDNGLGIVVESEGLEPTGKEEVQRCIDYLHELDKADA